MLVLSIRAPKRTRSTPPPRVLLYFPDGTTGSITVNDASRAGRVSIGLDLPPDVRIVREQASVLCEIVLLDTERHELIQAYERRQVQRPYPPLSVQIFIQNVRTDSVASVYRAYVSEVLDFAKTAEIEWLEQRIVDAVEEKGRT